ncbi:hypothetical protein DIPPA_10077 [Diplonema papillatum]|nr:hypothetical protein DIPPA_10077 [Diplonema papillatum]
MDDGFEETPRTVVVHRPSAKDSFGMHVNPNLVVIGVNEDGPAERADIALGCKIVAVNGKPVHDLNATKEALQGVSCEITLRDPLPAHDGEAGRARSSFDQSRTSLDRSEYSASHAAKKQPMSPSGGAGGRAKGLLHLKKAGNALLSSAFASGDKGAAHAASALIGAASTLTGAPDASLAVVEQEDGTFAASHEAYTRLKKETDAHRKMIGELQNRHAKSIGDAKKFKDLAASANAHADTVSAEHRKLAELLARSKTSGAKDELENRLRHAEELKEQDLKDFTDQQAACKVGLKLMRSVNAMLVEKEKEGGSDGDAPATDAGTEEENVNRVQQMLDEAVAALKQIDQDILTRDAEIKRSTAAFEALRTELADQDSLLFHYTEQNDSLRLENEAHHNERKKLSFQVQELNSQLEATVKDLMDKIRLASEAKDKEVAKAGASLTEAQSGSNGLHEKMRDKEAELEGLRKANRLLQVSSSEMKRRQPEILGQIEDLIKEAAPLADAEAACDQVEQERYAKKAGHELCVAQAKELEKMNTGLMCEVTALTDMLAVQAKQLSEEVVKGTTGQAKVDENRTRLDSLRPLLGAVDALKLEVQAKDRELAVEKELCVDLERKVKAERTRQADIQREMEEGEKEVNSVEETTLSCYNEVVQLAEEFEGLVRKHAKAKKEAVKSAQAGVVRVEEKVRGLQSRLRVSEGRYKDAMTKIGRLESTLRRPTTDSGNTYEVLKQESEQLMLKVSQMQDRLRKAETEKRTARAALKERQVEVAKKEAVIQLLQLGAAQPPADHSPRRFLTKLAKPKKSSDFEQHIVEELVYEDIKLKKENAQLQSALKEALAAQR